MINPYRYYHEAIYTVIYGFGRCGHREFSIVLYRFNIKNDDHFYYCIRQMVINAIIYHCLAFFTLIFRSNSMQNRRSRIEKMENHHRLARKSSVILPELGCHKEFVIKKIQI